jgi:NADH-quinone oxidoreductase subunit M
MDITEKFYTLDVFQHIVIAPIWGIFLNNILFFYLPKTGKCFDLWNFNFRLSLSIFALSLLLWPSLSWQQGSNAQEFYLGSSWAFGTTYTYGLDRISLFFIILTTFIFPLCFLYSWDLVMQQNIAKHDLLNYLNSFFFLQYCILNVFLAKDLFTFFIFFEATLLPMILIIGSLGPGDRRIKANYYFIFYTLVGSILLLFSILVIYVEKGTVNFLLLFNSEWDNIRIQLLLWFCFFLSFAIKMPMFPFHIWLPEAHVEAPTTASVILAALLLKLGGYGFIRFIPIFPYAYIFFNPLMYTLGIISIIYASLVTIRQIDLKKIIAYSSVAHMNLCTIGIFSLNYQGIQGSIFLMLGHGIVSSALFFLVGMLYDRYYTKFLRYYGGLVITMPIYASIFFFFSLANLGFPGTCNFIGEFLILAGAISKNISIMILTATGMLFSSIYSIWLFNRLCFGNLKVQYINKYKEIKGIEFFCLLPLILLTIILGIAPDIILNYTYQEIKNLTLIYS